MGCVAGKLSKKKLRKKQRQRSISVSASAPNHMVALTSSTYGVLRVDSSPRAEAKCKAKAENQNQVEVNKSLNQTSKSHPLKGLDGNNWVEKKVIEEENAGTSGTEDQPVTTINAWELMAGLDDIGESPAKKCLQKQAFILEKKTSFYHTVEEIDAQASGNASEKKCFGKENARPKQISTPGKVKSAFCLSSPLGEIDFNKSNSPENVGFHVGSVPSKQRMRRPGSHGSMTDLKFAASRRLDSSLRLSLDLIKEPSSPLFDPNLLASFEKALENLSEEEWNTIKKSEGQHRRKSPREGRFPWAAESDKNKDNPLGSFEEKCPPGGANAVVLYTTTLRGIRKTFEDCNNVRDALESYGICISERDVSMHFEFRNELRKLMGGKLVTVPRLFIKGRYIGGADEALRIHEEGKMAELLAGIPTGMAGIICDGCGGVRFIPCMECSGSCKLVNDDNMVVRCPECNENGLIQCPICC
uniref:Glutaredoxin domain-containing protein n=1 Tax=Picea sitchensis TaxID=3332 RepID=A9NX84_PICSI|nr:unknown [Picea sitchensis]